ncbi:MAG: NAD(P)H-dependent oxidoreductase [Verrucomicrobiae bacterium]|nr:NAD(P)H-dependent oxidoreductase [Verrucomicrobiae bacterium]MCP5541191.1 NAD(P)H-dependent oxidoreductase [Akkermansiaceae bacterium]MCP5550469.1 NAD(P)H-dependent oxidoreductase [Akkermansiaceae bacterium]
MNPVPGSQILDHLRWRYATKRFDPTRRIPDADWAALEEALILTPSSYGLQPWKFLVITRQDTKESLVAPAYNQRQVADCSHLLVFAVRREMTEADADRLIDFTAETRGIDRQHLSGYRNVMVGDIVTGARSREATHWAQLQSYIALGNFMTCAALMGIDTCPMEGFMAPAFDEALDLAEKGLTTSVLCPAGYRDESDKYAALPKVRYPKADLIEHLP